MGNRHLHPDVFIAETEITWADDMGQKRWKDFVPGTNSLRTNGRLS